MFFGNFTVLSGVPAGIKRLTDRYSFVIYDTDATNMQIGRFQLWKYFAECVPSATEASTVTLLRMKNCNIAVGNIIGSNMFNFIILSAADMISTERSVYAVLDDEIRNLMIFGAAATVVIWIMLRRKNKTTQLVCSLGILLCYLAFLLA